MFKKNKVYKHVNNTDVAFHVTGVLDMHLDGTFVQGRWMRITPMGKLHDLNAHDSITLKDKDFDSWKEYEEEA